jgi:NAD(P)-dependent dehydrogenase (short-subunit alcohol dehydrogenase family)
VAGTVERFGGIDIVLANAGIATGGPAHLINPADFERLIDVNLLGVWRTVRAALPHVTERSGYVLPIASLAAALHAPMMSPYCMSKAGVEAFCNCLRTEVRHTGTAVGCGYFSFIDTDMVRRGMDSAAGQKTRERLRGPLKPPPVSVAGEAIVRGMEKRSRFVYAPRWVKPALYLRTVLQPLTERGVKDADVTEAIELFRTEPSRLTTEQPSKAVRS